MIFNPSQKTNENQNQMITLKEKFSNGNLNADMEEIKNPLPARERLLRRDKYFKNLSILLPFILSKISRNKAIEEMNSTTTRNKTIITNGGLFQNR